MTKGSFGTTTGAVPGAASQGCQPNALGGGYSMHEVPVFPLSQAKGVMWSRKRAASPRSHSSPWGLTWARSDLRRGAQGGAHGKRRRGGVGNEAAPVWGHRARKRAVGSPRMAGRVDGAPRNRAARERTRREKRMKER